MKTYPNLTDEDITRFEQYAQQNDLTDWKIGITKDMSLAEVERYLIARCRVKDYKKLTPEDIFEFEKSIESEGFTYDFLRIRETVTPRQLQKFAKSFITIVKGSITRADSKPMTAGQ
jgi:hypothetical protein